MGSRNLKRMGRGKVSLQASWIPCFRWGTQRSDRLKLTGYRNQCNLMIFFCEAEDLILDFWLRIPCPLIENYWISKNLVLEDSRSATITIIISCCDLVLLRFGCPLFLTNLVKFLDIKKKSILDFTPNVLDLYENLLTFGLRVLCMSTRSRVSNSYTLLAPKVNRLFFLFR